MADNVAITAGAGTSVATDDVGGAHYQRVKVNWGVDGARVDASASAPLPVALYSSGGTEYSADAAVSRAHLVTAATTNATSIKASAGKLRSVHVFNAAVNYPVFVKFHNTAGTPTAGSGVLVTVGCQSGSQRDVVFPGNGISFGTGIGMTVVKDIADAGATAVATSDAVIEVTYE